MVTIILIATKSIRYGGRTLASGDVFAARPIDALAFTYNQQATLAPKQALLTRHLEPELSVTEPAKPKRRYRRRDMQPTD